MSTAAPPPTPTILNGRYELQRRLAQGGMAEVWLANDLTLDRRVAVKWLKPNLASDEVVAERFRREAIAAASLNHANIVAIHDVFEHAGRQAVVMQLVDGKSLRQLLDSQKRLSPELTCHIGACVAAALEHAHKAGFVHRDVKPGNIMLTPDGRVLLTDFGIAKALSGGETDLTSDNVMMGTAKYLSPEQVRGKRLDGRADLYSLGLVLYECLAGRVPFLGETDADTALARLQRDPTDLARLRATLPAGLIAVVHQLLARNPQRRPATGAETAEALERARREGPPHIDPTEAADAPVIPAGPGRLQRAASDHRGRAVDRRRAARTRDDERGDDDNRARRERGRDRRRQRAPVDQRADEQAPLASPGDVAQSRVGTLAPSRGNDTPIPGEPPNLGITGGTPTTHAGSHSAGRAATTPAAALTPPSRATRAVDPPRTPPAGQPPVNGNRPQRDNTPVAGPTVKRGTPARGLGQSTRSSKTMVIALIAIGALVVAMLWLSISYGGGEPSAPTSILPSELTNDDTAGEGDTGAEATADEPAADIATGLDAMISSAIAFDPDGDGVENDGAARLTIDGDPSTSWSTVCYSSRFLGGKRGVGIVVTFEQLSIAQLAVAIDSSPYQLNFYASAEELPPLQLDGWGEPLGPTSFDDSPGTVVSPLPTVPVRHVFVAVSEIASADACSGDNPYRGTISEITVAS